MTHVLLDRNLAAANRIRRQLNLWGMTSGWFDPQVDGSCWPGILDCDLAVVSAVAAGRLATHSSDLMAPSILLGVSGPLLLARNAWQGLPQSDPDRETLQQAVHRALEQSAILRSGYGAKVEQEEFLAYMSHEMRSPLTAAKTSLEILTDSFTELDDGQSGSEEQHHMADIVRRNLDRLQQTVEWSQGLLMTYLAPPDVQLEELDIPELEVILNQHFALHVDPALRDSTIRTDPVALVQLLRQLGRALAVNKPYGTLDLKVGKQEGPTDRLELQLCAQCPAGKDDAAHVSRMGLVSPGPCRESSTRELEGFVQSLVATPLTFRLGVEIRVMDNALSLTLPLVADMTLSSVTAAS